MQDLNDLAWFVQVIDHGGFAAAGRALDQPKSKLSRRIAQLEERLGVRLIQRTTRQFAVTEVGLTFYQHCKAMLIEAEAAEQAVETLRSEPRGGRKADLPGNAIACAYRADAGTIYGALSGRESAAGSDQPTR